MIENWKNDDFCVIKEKLIPTNIRFEKDITDFLKILRLVLSYPQNLWQCPYGIWFMKTGFHNQISNLFFI
mgnify:CR=1 FL=1